MAKPQQANCHLFTPRVNMSYAILAYYYFTPIEDPAVEVLRHKEFFNTRDIKGRIYLSPEGIHGQMSASFPAAEE